MLDFTVLPASLWNCEWALPLIKTPVFFIQLLILEGRRSSVPWFWGAGSWHPNHLETSGAPPACHQTCVCVTRPQHWGPECPPVEVLERKVSR